MRKLETAEKNHFLTVVKKMRNEVELLSKTFKESEIKTDGKYM